MASNASWPIHKSQKNEGYQSPHQSTELDNPGHNPTTFKFTTTTPAFFKSRRKYFLFLKRLGVVNRDRRIGSSTKKGNLFGADKQFLIVL
jgi:hypothetical protein